MKWFQSLKIKERLKWISKIKIKDLMKWFRNIKIKDVTNRIRNIKIKNIIKWFDNLKIEERAEWFRNTKIRYKFIITFAIMISFILLIGAAGYINMGKSHKNAETIYEEKLLPISELSVIQKNLLTIQLLSNDMLLNRNVSNYEKKIKQIEAMRQENNELLQRYEANKLTDGEQKLLSDFYLYLDSYREASTRYLKYIENKNYSSASAVSNGVNNSAYAVNDAIDDLIEENILQAELLENSISKNFNRSSISMLLLICIGSFIIIIIGAYISKYISTSIKKLLTSANQIADNNLNVAISIDSTDEFGNLAKAFNTMSDNINKVLTNINTASEQVAAGAKQVSDSSTSLSQGATEQASSVEQLNASIREIAKQTKQNAENANVAKEIVELSKKNAGKGNKQINAMLEAMSEINDSSNNISRIIKVIDEIAFQTNILALNAAIEAARAGQHGKTFAVVAEEVRNLATRSANAAKETTAMIENSINKISAGTEIANATSKALYAIVEDVAKANELIEEITHASNQQAVKVEQINEGIGQISDVVQTTSATSEETAAASEELSTQAHLLKEQVFTFKLKDASTINSSQEPVTSEESPQIDLSYKPKESEELEEINPDILQMLDSLNEDTPEEIPTSEQLSLDDNDFGKY